MNSIVELLVILGKSFLYIMLFFVIAYIWGLINHTDDKGNKKDDISKSD